MNKEEKMREIKEAIIAGRRAMSSLQRAEEYLSSAGNWGLFDLFGGGFFSGMIKHSKINDAQQEMEDARYQLRIFQKELRDIDVPMEFRIDIGEFLKFADFFFDGFIADWMVQSRIREAEKQIFEAKQRVQVILNDLNSWENQLLSD